MNWYAKQYLKLAACDFSIVYHASAGEDAYGWGHRVDYLAFVSPVQEGDSWNDDGWPYRITLLQADFDAAGSKVVRMKPASHTYLKNCEDTDEAIGEASFMSGVPKDAWHPCSVQKAQEEIGVSL
jgi:hypothetical protein